MWFSVSSHVRLAFATNTCNSELNSAYEPSGPSGWRLSLVSVARSVQEYFNSRLDAMLVHYRVIAQR